MNRGSEKVKKWRKRTKSRMVDSFGGKCCICNKKYPPEVFDFHHLEQEEKSFNLSCTRANSISWPKIVVELKKCIMVCSNCHRMIHANVIKIPKDPTRFNENFSDYKKLEDKKRYNICPVCGGEKLKVRKFCSIECRSISFRKVERPSKEELIALMEEFNWTELGRRFGVSDNAIRKWARRYGLLERNSI